MSIHHGLFTSEAVSAGHPDKLCDRISDAVLDAFLERDPHARVACEALAAHDKILVAGEFRTAERRHFDEVRDRAEDIVRGVLREVGYGTEALDIDPDTCDVEVRFNHQSPEIAAGVDGAGAMGAGDQGLMFGYATDETDHLMPLAWSLATDLVARGTELRAGGALPLRPDAKSQVTVRYAAGRPVGVDTVVLSWQHDPDADLNGVRDVLRTHVVDAVVPPELRLEGFRLHLNPAGRWTVGGPRGDRGLTGRKIIVDTYGGACPHGCGAFSGKDPSKVDRSGAYAARWVARTVVAAGLARTCTVQLAYAIGVAEPISVLVDTHGTGRAPDADIERAVREVFDFTPAGILRDLDLLRPIYRETSLAGAFRRVAGAGDVSLGRCVAGGGAGGGGGRLGRERTPRRRRRAGLMPARWWRHDCPCGASEGTEKVCRTCGAVGEDLGWRITAADRDQAFRWGTGLERPAIDDTSAPAEALRRRLTPCILCEEPACSSRTAGRKPGRGARAATAWEARSTGSS